MQCNERSWFRHTVSLLTASITMLTTRCHFYFVKDKTMRTQSHSSRVIRTSVRRSIINVYRGNIFVFQSRRRRKQRNPLLQHICKNDFKHSKRCRQVFEHRSLSLLNVRRAAPLTWDALCLLAVWPWADVEGICPFRPHQGLSDPPRPRHLHPEGAADV